MHFLLTSGLQLPKADVVEQALFRTSDEPLTDDKKKM
jgi:hypothetical protein